jgi:cation diffusion facilitator CzcD-associated flavoprotein CzcO
MNIKAKHKVLIVGTGFSGICAAIRLRQNGIEDFVMVEKEDKMGGTWYVNKYPGAAVDVMSYLYCYSFEPYNWSRKYAMQDEIFAYTNYVIDKHKLREKALLNSKVVDAKYNESTGTWLVTVENGDVYEGDYVFGAFGVLVDPSYPTLKGMDTYKGAQFHSAKWDTKYDISGKRVAVIGTAASAVQVIPAIVDKVGHLTVFQRTAHWVTPRLDRPFKPWERTFLQLPFIQPLYRMKLYLENELRMIAFAKIPSLMKFPEKFCKAYLNKKITDPVLREKLTPNFGFGCKRVLVTSAYYPALLKSNVVVESNGVKEITSDGIITGDGKEIKVDAIVYCTGFNVVNYLPFEITGLNGKTLSKSFERGMHAYLGSLVPGFPKAFITLGPNTGVGHTSALILMESQVEMAIKIIKEAEAKKWKTIDIKEEVEVAYNDMIQEKLKSTIWVKGGCKSWYQDKDGKNRVIFPDFNFVFARWAKKPDFSKFNIVKR